jgi:hypothetical protein
MSGTIKYGCPGSGEVVKQSKGETKIRSVGGLSCRRERVKTPGVDREAFYIERPV